VPKGYKRKVLIEAMSFHKLQDLCKKKGWVIPSMEDIINIEHESIWVSDKPKCFDDDDPNDYATLLFRNGKMTVANRNFKENCIVLKKDVCFWKDGKTECGYTVGDIGNDWKFCPYCSLKITEEKDY